MDFAAGVVEAYRLVVGERLDALQYPVWDDATTVPVKLGAVDQVLSIIAARIRLLGLAAVTAPEPKRRRNRRRVPPGPHEVIIVGPHMDPQERAEVEALIAQWRQCEPGDVSPPNV